MTLSIAFSRVVCTAEHLAVFGGGGAQPRISTIDNASSEIRRGILSPPKGNLTREMGNVCSLFLTFVKTREI